VRRGVTAAGALLLQLAWAPAASAGEPSAQPPPAPAVVAERSYAVQLGAAYTIAPLLALGIGGLLSKAEASDEVAVAAASTMFLAPAAVHLYEDRSDHVALSLISMVGITFGGVLLGGAAGHYGNQLLCDPDQNSECDDHGIGVMIEGAVIGGFVGYIGSAVLDIVLRSSTPAQSTSEPSAVEKRVADQRSPAGSATLWLEPVSSAGVRGGLPAARRPGGANPLAADGLVIGLRMSL
jgi:hypothetical protein